MASLAFDTHKFVTRLTGAGMSAEQAAVLAETYAALITDRLATRDDVAALREEMSREFAARQAESQKDRAVLRSEIYARIAYGNLATVITLSAVMGVLLQLFG